VFVKSTILQRETALSRVPSNDLKVYIVASDMCSTTIQRELTAALPRQKWLRERDTLLRTRTLPILSKDQK